ncbi:MAG: hypothetical protein ACO37W_14435, partial [Prochlorotrichaceae cyanobacterium]
MIMSEAERQVQSKYEKMGYEVIPQPAKEMLPFDLGGYIPDLLCKNKEENILIEVKGRVWKDSLETYKTIAKIINQYNGWKFFIIQMKDLYDSRDPIQNVTKYDYDRYMQKINNSKKAGLFEAALVYAWNLLILLFRLKVEQDSSILLETTDKNLINTLYSDGAISLPDYDQLLSLMIKRNESVHNILTNVDENDVDILLGLIEQYNGYWHNLINRKLLDPHYDDRNVNPI